MPDPADRDPNIPEIACRCWKPEEADRRFGRNRPRKGIIHCAKCLGG